MVCLQAARGLFVHHEIAGSPTNVYTHIKQIHPGSLAVNHCWRESRFYGLCFRIEDITQEEMNLAPAVLRIRQDLHCLSSSLFPHVDPLELLPVLHRYCCVEADLCRQH